MSTESRVGGARRRLLLLLLVALACLADALAAQDATALAHILRARVQRVAESGAVGVGGDRLFALDLLGRFYEARGFEPAWLGARATDLLAQLEAATRRAAAHGLEPAEYHIGSIDELRPKVESGTASAAELVALELFASDAFMTLGSHLLRGRSDPAAVEAEWLSRRRAGALDRVLAEALERADVEAALYALAPADPRYGQLVEASARLRNVVERGGWPRVTPGPRLDLAARGPRVAELRTRLLASGDLEGSMSGGGPSVAGDPAAGTLDALAADRFDEQLDEAVRRFQARHGLEVDGIVGRATAAALNVPAEKRLRQVAINLDRWRWLPADLGERHIEVNVPAFDLSVVEGGRTVRRHRVVVGIEDRQTPMLSGTMTQVVLSPSWTVPPTVAAEDLLPQIRRDPGVLAAQRMTLMERSSGAVIDPMTLNWSLVTATELNSRYLLRQAPGPSNALGTVKFAFSNGHSVFLHDTPAQALFERSVRDFSSGCIRVQNAIDLAVYVLADQPEWTRERIETVASSGVERAVLLTRGIPVHLMYWTAWVGEDEVLHFRDDLYGRDETVRRALLIPPSCW